MSELCMYELEDNVWDEFGAADDHIVPHTISDCSYQFILQSDTRKKPRHEEIGGTCDAANVSKYGTQGKEKKGCLVQVKDTMLEKNSWSHSPDGAFPTSSNNDSLEQAVNIASDDPSRELENGKIDSVSSEFCAPVDNAYRYPVNHTGQTEDDLNFFNDGNEGKDSSELLYYNWPDIGNFEDVDRMFRSCDSTFGLGSLSNEDELCWFSSSHFDEGSEDALNNSSAAIDGLPQQYSPSNPDSSCAMSDDPSGIKSRRKDDVITDGNISQNKLLFCQVGKSEEQKRQHLENGGYFQQYDNVIDPEEPNGDSYCQAFCLSNLLDHKQKFGCGSLSHVQSYTHISNGSPPEQISFGTISGTTSENNGCPSSTKESSYGSNNVRSTESSICPSFEVPPNVKKVLPHNQQGAQASYGSIKSGKKPARKLAHQAEQDGYSEVKGGSKGNKGVMPDIDSSNVWENSCMSSAFDEISLEATSFRQLQQVTEKLDIRTKLCIRDSLYRLARSAEQRHNSASANGSVRGDKEESEVLMNEETNKCSGFMDIETDTNPIDRSIAHLLFHRPSDPSLVHSNGTPHMNHGSRVNPPVVAEEFIANDGTGAVGLEDEMPIDRK